MKSNENLKMKKTLIIAAAMAAVGVAGSAMAGEGYLDGSDAHMAFAKPLADAGLETEAFLAVHAACPRRDDKWCEGWDAFTRTFDAAYAEETEKAAIAHKAAVERNAIARRALEEDARRRGAEQAAQQDAQQDALVQYGASLDRKNAEYQAAQHADMLARVQRMKEAHPGK
jgi:hypothetical protein